MLEEGQSSGSSVDNFDEGDIGVIESKSFSANASKF